MKTQELQRDQWPAFCRKLATERHGSLITVLKSTDSGLEVPVVEGAPLEEMVFAEHAHECSDTLHIKAGGIDHEIVEPIRILLRNGGNDRYNRLEILAESGTTVLQVNPGLPPNF